MATIAYWYDRVVKLTILEHDGHRVTFEGLETDQGDAVRSVEVVMVVLQEGQSRSRGTWNRLTLYW